jgi:hypothetical protein
MILESPPLEGFVFFGGVYLGTWEFDLSYSLLVF